MSDDATSQPDGASDAGSKGVSGAGQQSVPPQDIAQALAAVRGMLRAGRQDEAEATLRRLVAIAPGYEEPWLQLLALNPPPEKEVVILEDFLRYHPQHRFAQAFRTRLHDMQIVVMLSETKQNVQPDAGTFSASMRLGDYLIMRNWATIEKIERALEDQRKLRQTGQERRLGTVLLMNGHITEEQLGIALAEATASGFGELGDYLVRNKLLTPHQVGQALARQAAITARHDREYFGSLAEVSQKFVSRLLGKRPPEPQRKPVPRLGEIMVSMGLLTAEQVETILQAREKEFNASFF